MKRKGIALALIAAALVAAAFWRSRPAPRAALPLPQFTPFAMAPGLYDSAFAAAGEVRADPAVQMVVVNHHLVAADLIARTLGVMATGEPVTVVLVSPDHFGVGAAPISSVVAQWPTPYGTIEPDAATVTSLADADLVNLQELPFVHEHGITTITPFINRLLPQARLVPIIFRDHASDARVDALVAAVAKLPGPVLVVGSFDFTHDSTMAQAEANDRISVGVLTAGDPAQVSKVAVDSRPGIRFLLSYARLRGLNFTLGANTNSARVLHRPDQTDVTSYIVGTWAPGAAVVQ